MSYDLYLYPRAGADATAFVANARAYFRDRMHFSMDGDQAWYRNEDTGTYFVFILSESHLHFNLTTFRPLFFVKEAEPELSTIVSTLDLQVVGSADQGDVTQEYEPARMRRDWYEANERGYKTRTNEARTEPLFVMPASDTENAWRWNLARARKREEFGTHRFVPRIMFFAIDGRAHTAAMWPDAIAALLPRVEYLIIHRQAFAPRRFLIGRPDVALVPWREAAGLIDANSGGTDETGYLLAYDKPPKAVAEFVKQLPAYSAPLDGIATAAVLDADLVARYQRV